jgi:F420-dependent NADP oxidoreductase-like protein
MRIGILGSGLMGGKLGTIFARAKHQVVVSYSHSERKLKRLAREAGAHVRAGTPRESALDADALLLELVQGPQLPSIPSTMVRAPSLCQRRHCQTHVAPGFFARQRVSSRSCIHAVFGDNQADAITLLQSRTC